MLHQLIYCWGQQQTIIMYYYEHSPIASLGSCGLVHQGLLPRVSTPAQHTLGLHKCGSVFLFQAVPRQPPWTKTQPPDAHSWVPSPGLATVSTPSIIVHPGSLDLLLIGDFELLFVWFPTQDQTTLSSQLR